MIACLLQWGADALLKDGSGRLPLRIAVEHGIAQEQDGDRVYKLFMQAMCVVAEGEDDRALVPYASDHTNSGKPDDVGERSSPAAVAQF